jgi:hypothetical protein
MLLFVLFLCLKILMTLVIVASCLSIFLKVKVRSIATLHERLNVAHERAKKVLEIAERQVEVKKCERSLYEAEIAKLRKAVKLSLMLAFCAVLGLAIELFVPPKLRWGRSD